MWATDLRLGGTFLQTGIFPVVIGNAIQGCELLLSLPTTFPNTWLGSQIS